MRISISFYKLIIICRGYLGEEKLSMGLEKKPEQECSFLENGFQNAIVSLDYWNSGVMDEKEKCNWIVGILLLRYSKGF